MQVIKTKSNHAAVALLVLAGIFLCAPQAARSDEVIATAPRAIMLPMMRVGGIPQGQVMQITENGSELVSAARVALAAATQAGAIRNAAAEVKEAKIPPRLFCAGSM
jgi:hypothetical protein